MAGRAVVVVGACGGAGASTLATLLAMRAASRPGGRGGPVALVDLAGAGGGLDVLLGVEEVPGARWGDLEAVRGSVRPEDLAGVLPRGHGIELLSGDRRGGAPPPEALVALWAALRERCGTLVADLPAARVAALGRAVLAPGTGIVLVTPQDVRGVGAGLAACAALTAVVGESPPAAAAARPHLVVRRRRAARVAPLEVAQVLDLPLVAVAPHDRGVAESVDRGLGPRPGRGLRRAVDAVAGALGA